MADRRPSSASPEQGLSAREAQARLRKLGPPPETSSRSTASIIAGNVFTLFNAIIGAFFVLDLALGLYADSIFGLIAVVNSYIGIRQELKAKATLDELAVLVAPHAKVVRDGEVVELTANEVVPGDVVRVGPGDQLVADGEVIHSRGMTMDESLLTGESDGIRKGEGDGVLSGSFCVSGSGHYAVEAVREESYAGRLAGEARTFRHPPSPLQEEVNRVIIASTYVMLPLAALLIVSLKVRSVRLESAAQTATAGLVTLIPEGLVLLMSVTFAVAAVRLARRDTLVQQMSATESLAAVDTICVDKTGTLTAGELRLAGVEFADGVDPASGAKALGRFAASAGDRNRTLETIAEKFPGQAGRVSGEVPFSSEWKWSGVSLDGARRRHLRDGRARRARRGGALTLPPGWPRSSKRRPRPAGGSSPSARPARRCRATRPRRGAAADAAGAGRAGGDAAPRRGGDDRLHARRAGRPEADLRRRGATVTAVAYAVGVEREAGVIEGPDLPEDEEGLQRAALENTIFCRIKPEQKKALVAALVAAGRYVAMIGDGVNDVPALKRARMAVAMGSGAQVTKGVADVVLLEDQFSRLPEAVGEGRRIARNIHRLGRLYLTKTVYAAALILLVAVPGFAFPFLPRHLTVAAFLTIGVPSFVLALVPSDGPLYRGRLLRALAAFAVPAGVATALGSILSFFLVDTVVGASLEAGRTAATTTLIVLGLCFVLLLERGPGREHIAIQCYMLALVVGLAALFAGILAIAPLRDFFEMELLSATEWFLALFSAAVGLTIASVLWKLPQIEAWKLSRKTPDRRISASSLARVQSTPRSLRPPICLVRRPRAGARTGSR